MRFSDLSEGAVFRSFRHDGYEAVMQKIPEEDELEVIVNAMSLFSAKKYYFEGHDLVLPIDHDLNY